MTALLSILALIGAWAALISLDPIRWPWQREEPLYDCGYWQAVKTDSLAYLATHKAISTQIRGTVEQTIATANRKMGVQP